MSDLENFLLTHLNLGISAHNSQPFLYSFLNSDKVIISVNPSRKLPHADPHNKDLQMSLGAAVQTLEALLKSKGYEIGAIELNLLQPGFAHVIYQKYSRTEDRELNLLNLRFSYRGAFDKASLPISVADETNLKFSSHKKVIEKVAHLYDEVNYRFITKPGYLEELYSWLRFWKLHHRWKTDGLNAEAMSLGLVEALGGAVAMRPQVFNVLDKIGVGRLLIEEGPKIKSAPYLVAIYAEESLNHFEQGRIFLKSWLRLTELGLYGAPLSLLTDHPGATKMVLELLELPPTACLINVLRVGSLPKKFKPYPRARLSPSEILDV